MSTKRIPINQRLFAAIVPAANAVRPAPKEQTATAQGPIADYGHAAIGLLKAVAWLNLTIGLVAASIFGLQVMNSREGWTGPGAGLEFAFIAYAIIGCVPFLVICGIADNVIALRIIAARTQKAQTAPAQV